MVSKVLKMDPAKKIKPPFFINGLNCNFLNEDLSSLYYDLKQVIKIIEILNNIFN